MSIVNINKKLSKFIQNLSFSSIFIFLSKYSNFSLLFNSSKSLLKIFGGGGLAPSIGAGLSVGEKISAGQPSKTRIATTAGIELAGVEIQVGATALNKSLVQLSSNQTEEILNNHPSPLGGYVGFINSSNEEILDNPVELLLYSIWVLQFVILIFLIVLLFTFISKLILSINYEIKWLNYLFSEQRSVQIRTFILKSFNILSKIREFNIIILIVVLIIISLFSLYFFSVYLLNLEGMCKLYLAKKV